MELWAYGILCLRVLACAAVHRNTAPTPPPVASREVLNQPAAGQPQPAAGGAAYDSWAAVLSLLHHWDKLSPEKKAMYAQMGAAAHMFALRGIGGGEGSSGSTPTGTTADAGGAAGGLGKGDGSQGEAAGGAETEAIDTLAQAGAAAAAAAAGATGGIQEPLLDEHGLPPVKVGAGLGTA